LWPAAKAPQRDHILFLTSGTKPNLRHQASGGGTVTITSSVAIVNDSTWSTIVGTWRPGRLELYVDGWSRASSTAAATNTSASFGIYRWGWGFSTLQDFNGDIALIACFASSWTPAMVRRWHADLGRSRGAGRRRAAAARRRWGGHLPDGVRRRANVWCRRCFRRAVVVDSLRTNTVAVTATGSWTI
jgi:hypothetical protein